MYSKEKEKKNRGNCGVINIEIYVAQSKNIFASVNWDLGIIGCIGFMGANPRNMNIFTSKPRSSRCLFMQMITWDNLRTSSAYSNNATNPSLDPSRMKSKGTMAQRRCCQMTVSHSIETSLITSLNFTGKLSFSSRSSTSSDSEERTTVFPTPRTPSVLVTAEWGTSGTPQRPCAQADAVLSLQSQAITGNLGELIKKLIRIKIHVRVIIRNLHFDQIIIISTY